MSEAINFIINAFAFVWQSLTANVVTGSFIFVSILGLIVTFINSLRSK